jgi:hypothetical protein
LRLVAHIALGRSVGAQRGDQDRLSNHGGMAAPANGYVERPGYEFCAKWVATAQPTILRLKASSTTAWQRNQPRYLSARGRFFFLYPNTVHESGPTPKNGYRFSSLVGSVFENTNYPLPIWFEVSYLICQSM